MKREHVLQARVHIIVGFLLAAFCVFMACKASGQALRTDLTYTDQYGHSDYVVVLAWAGPDNGQDRRVYVWTSSSASAAAKATPPWDEVGENPYQHFVASAIPATQRVQDEATGQFRTEPIPGWLLVPVRRGKISIPSENRWVDDVHLRVTIYITDQPWCSSLVCGARYLLPRADLFLIPRVPGTTRRRAVSP